MTAHALAEDLVRVRGDLHDRQKGASRRGAVLRTLYWGDPIELVDEKENAAPSVRDVRVRVPDESSGEMREAFVRKRRRNGVNLPLELRPPGSEKLLSVTFADLHHGDATLIRTPGGRQLLIDGAEESRVAGLLRDAFAAGTAVQSVLLDALVISHGDGEHFSGLAALADGNLRPRSFGGVEVRTSRYYHNGLVKRPEKRAGRRVRETERLGAVRRIEGEYFVTDLRDDPRSVPATSRDFERWSSALGALVTSNGPVLRRLRAGDHDAFDFLLGEGIEVLVLGPVEELVQGQSALRFLRDDAGEPSASRTIERHSVVLKLTYGNVRFLIGGGFGVEESRRVLDWASSHFPPVPLVSEILRVPHHGAGEPLPDFFRSVAPVVSLVTTCAAGSGERPRPAPELLKALRRCSRGAAAAVLWTGAVQIRTDGQRVLVARERPAERSDEAYAFRVDATGAVTPTSWARA